MVKHTQTPQNGQTHSNNSSATALNELKVPLVPNSLSLNLNIKNFMVSFYGWGFKCLKAADPVRGDSILLRSKNLTTKSLGVPETHLIDFKWMKG